MSELHIGPHTKTDPHPPHPETEAFDREINVKAIAKTVIGLVVVALVVHVLMWWLIKGFNRLDDARAPAAEPMAEANIQPPPPEPRLQTSPEGDLRMMRAQEDNLLGQPGWVDQGKGTVRIPIEAAMEVIAGRGLGAEVVGGTPGSAGTAQQPGQAQTVEPAAAPPQERR